MPTNPTDVVNPGFTINALTPIVLTLDPVRGENGEPGSPGQGINWRGVWQTGLSYNAYDAVSRNGASYIAIVNNTSVDPATDNGSVWGVLSAPGTPGPPGPPGTQYRGAWNSATSYVLNDLVTQQGATYIAVAPSTNVNPSTDGGTHWQVFAAAGSGGDMYKATYDPDGDGTVTSAASAAVASSVPYSGVTGKPATFPSDWNTTVNKPVTLPPSPHETTHLVGGSDALPLAGSATAGLLRQTSGLTTDFIDGTNACQNLVTAIQPTIWSARLRSFNAVGNPNFEVDQRNVHSGTSTIYPAGSSTQMQCDRWNVSKNAATAVLGAACIATNTNIPGTNFRISQDVLSVVVNTPQASLAAGEYLLIQQMVEGPQWRELSSDVHSVSLLAFSSIALNFSVFIRDPTIASSLVKTVSLSAGAYTLITLPNLPVFSGGAFSQTPGTLGYYIGVALGAGTTFQAPATDVWQSGNFFGFAGQNTGASNNFLATNGAIFRLAFVQHEPGPVCSTLQDKPFTQNLLECKRYFQKSNPYLSAMPTSQQGNMIGMTAGPSSATVRCSLRYEVEMAQSPVTNCWDMGTTANAMFVDGVGSVAVSGGGSSITRNAKGFISLTLASTITNTSPVSGQWTADTGW